MTEDIYSHLYTKLAESLGITKKKSPGDCSKPSKKTKWDEKAITLLRNIKNRGRKVIRDWNHWKSGKEEKNGSWKAKLNRNINFINKNIVSFNWDIDILTN